MVKINKFQLTHHALLSLVCWNVFFTNVPRSLFKFSCNFTNKSKLNIFYVLFSLQQILNNVLSNNLQCVYKQFNIIRYLYGKGIYCLQIYGYWYFVEIWFLTISLRNTDTSTYSARSSAINFYVYTEDYFYNS